ncbi:MAG: Mu-like prophage major head subunit gpT family protein [Candidatus Omnitrophota bacterium]
MSVPINSASFSQMLDPSVGLRKVFFDSYDNYITRKAMVPIIYNMQGSTRQNEYALSVSALGDFEDFTANGQIVYDDISEGYKSTFTHNEWTKGIRITRSAKDDDAFGIFDGLVKQRGEAAARSRDKHGASVFNNAFTGTSGPDSLSLCNSAHTSTVSGVSTQSNSGTDTLNKTTVSATRLLMMKFQGLNGEVIDAEGDTLLVGVDKEEDAWVIIKTKGEPETDNNNLNFHFGKYKLIVWNKLTSSYDWFNNIDPLYNYYGVMYGKN